MEKVKRIVFLFIFSFFVLFLLYYFTLNGKNIDKQEISLGAGLVAEGEKDWVNAINIYKKLLEQNPNNPDLLIRVSDIQNSLKNHLEAEKALKEAKKLQPENVTVYIKLSETYAVEEKPKEALLTIEEALVLDPNNVEFLKKKAILEDWINEKPKKENIPATKEPISGPKPGTVAYFVEESQKFAMINKPHEALLAIEKAIRLEPNNIKNLIARAILSNWIGDLDRVQNSYKRVLKLEPKNRDALLGIARLNTTRNLLDKAVSDYQYYLELYPDSADAWIDYAQVQSWRGNFVLAFDAMESYRKKYGVTKKYKSEKARLLAMAGYSKESLCMLKPLLKQSPTDYNLLFTKILALQDNHQPREALDVLQKIQKSYPNRSENLVLRDIVTTPIRSNANLDAYRSHDTDGINIKRLKLYGQYYISPETAFLYDLKQENLYEPQISSGLQTIDNLPKIWNSAQRVGLSNRILPELQVEGRLGVAEIQKKASHIIYQLNGMINPLETTEISFQYGREIYAVSPKAVSLAIRQTYNRANFTWEPFTQFYVVAQGESSKFSDTNHSSLIRLSPRASVVRSQYINLDCGVMADRLRFSKNFNNGYYDPLLHQTYQFTSYATIKQSQNINYVLSVALGMHKDETMKKYAFAGDFMAQAIFGIFDNWQFILTASDAKRQGNPLNQTQGNSNYRVCFFNGMIVKRF